MQAPVHRLSLDSGREMPENAASRVALADTRVQVMPRELGGASFNRAVDGQNGLLPHWFRAALPLGHRVSPTVSAGVC